MFQVWFTYGGARSWRECRDTQERDAFLDYLDGVDGVADVDVVEV